METSPRPALMGTATWKDILLHCDSSVTRSFQLHLARAEPEMLPHSLRHVKFYTQTTGGLFEVCGFTRKIGRPGAATVSLATSAISLSDP